MAIHIYISAILLFLTAAEGSKEMMFGSSSAASRKLRPLAVGDSCNIQHSSCGNFQPCLGTLDCYCAASTEGTSACSLNQLCVQTPNCAKSSDCGPDRLCVPNTCCPGAVSKCVQNCTTPICRVLTTGIGFPGGGGFGIIPANPACTGVCGKNKGWGCCKFDSEIADCSCTVDMNSTCDPKNGQS